MHPVLRTATAALVFAGLTLAAFAAAAPASAEYQTVTGPLQQWVWAHVEGAPMTAAVVRSDGWLVVATGRRFDGTNMVGGGLLLVPPWGGTAIPFGDPPDRGVRAFGFTSLVQRGDRLFGLTSIPYETSTVGQRAGLFELDAKTGKVVAFHGEWWFPDLAVDPKTGDLTLWSFSCTGKCDPAKVDVEEADEEVAGTITHQLVRYDPDRRKTTAVLLPDAKDADIGGSSTCYSQRDTLTRCEEVFRLTYSTDGDTMFLGTARTGTNDIDVRGRDGAFRYRVSVPRPVDSLRFGPPSTCFGNALVFTALDGSTWAIPNAADPAAAGRNPVQVAAGAPSGVSGAAMTPDGNVLTLRRSEAVLLSCPGKPRPAPPVPVVGAAPPAAAAPTAAAPGGPPPAPNAVHAAPPAPAAPQPPPVQPPSLPAVAGPASHATQAVTSVNVGLADAQEEQPVYGLSASRLTVSRRDPVGGLGAVGVGAIAVVGFAVVTFLVIPDTRRSRAAVARPVQLRGAPPR